MMVTTLQVPHVAVSKQMPAVVPCTVLLSSHVDMLTQTLHALQYVGIDKALMSTGQLMMVSVQHQSAPTSAKT